MIVTSFSGLELRSEFGGAGACKLARNVMLAGNGELWRRPGLRSLGTVRGAGLVSLRGRPVVVTNVASGFPSYGALDELVIQAALAPDRLIGAVLTSQGTPLILVGLADGSVELHAAAINAAPSSTTKIDAKFDPEPLGLVKVGGRAAVLDRSGRFLRYSAVDNPEDPLSLMKWVADGTDMGAGYIEIGQFLGGSVPTGIAEWSGRVAIFSSQGVLLVRIAQDQISHSIEGVVTGPGLSRTDRGPVCVPIGGDLLYLSPAGIRSVSQSSEAQAAAESGLGGSVDQAVEELSQRPWMNATYWPKRGCVLWAFANGTETTVLCLARAWGGDGASGWTRWEFDAPWGEITANNDGLFLRSEGNLYRLDETQDGDAIGSGTLKDIEVLLEFHAARQKTWGRCEGMSLLLTGQAEGQLVVDGRPSLGADGRLSDETWTIPFYGRSPEWCHCRSAWLGRSLGLRVFARNTRHDWRLMGYELVGIKEPKDGTI